MGSDGAHFRFMAARTGGFTLLEVLIALLVITTGVLALAGTLGTSAALAANGRARGRIALVLESRMDRIRAELTGSAPACTPPAWGTIRHGDGVVESWRATARTGWIDVEVAATPPRSGAFPDTLFSMLPCP